MSEFRTAFITGASSGIGAALARHMAGRGLRVALAARRVDALEQVKTDIEGQGGQAVVYPLDVTDPTAVYETMRRADDELEGIDIVVANAGLAKGRWSGKLRWSDIETTLQVNVIGATATLTALLPRMLERKRGHLVGVSSLAAYRGLPKLAAYSGSKAYLSTFLESMRVDLRATPIAVTDVRPGYVETDLTAKRTSQNMLSADDAAREIDRAIVRRKAVHTFPLSTAVLSRTMANLPNGLYDRFATKAL